MLRHHSIDRICCLVLAALLLITCAYMGAGAAGWIASERVIGYENRLFDTARVHTLDIVMEDWDGFLATCTDEEYVPCHLVIDGESYKNVAIRAKGNTSLSSVTQYGNNRYSFKIEFDHYQTGGSYHGLDKLSLNNLIQDNTYLKDYFAYTLMRKGGAAAPLCSFVQINVGGQPWGLYLAVEGVEDSFLRRNFGNDTGELYKPDSMSFGAGRGNGKGFDMEEFRQRMEEETEAGGESNAGGMPDEGAVLPMIPPDGQPGFPEGMTMPGEGFGSPGDRGNRGGGRGMSSPDVLLQYTDDDPASYANIFDNAKTDVNEADQQRLIQSLKALSEGDTSVVDQQAVIRYLAVHNFLCNDDSYTGAMVHNYYLYEKDGLLSMLSWDYNLAFGGFGMGGGAGGSGATSTVNQPIDSPVTSGELSSRPILSWIFQSDDTLAAYHAAYRQFISEAFDSGWFAEEIDRISTLIAPYVQADPTAFCTYEEFQQGVSTLRAFCLLRAQSVTGQLDGTIPATSEGQQTTDALVDASHLNLSDMGSMGNTHGGQPGGFGGRDRGQAMPEGGGFPGGRGRDWMGQKGGQAAPHSEGETAQPAAGEPVQPDGVSIAPPATMPELPADAAESPAAGAPAILAQGSQPGMQPPAAPPGSETILQPAMGEPAQMQPPALPSEEAAVAPVNPTGSGESQEPTDPAETTTPSQFLTSRPVASNLPSGEPTPSTSPESWLLLGLCAVTLLVALVLVSKYQSNR